MAAVEKIFTPSNKHVAPVAQRVLKRVGVMIDMDVSRSVDVVRLTREGLPTSAVDALVERGFKVDEIKWIVPRRTLAHRKAKQGMSA